MSSPVQTPPPRSSSAAEAAAAPAQGWDPSTVRLKKGEVTLQQALLEGAQGAPCLIVHGGADAGRRVDLDRPHLIIGRQSDCNVQLDSASVSRRHAELAVAADRVLLRDLGSANGTWLNGRRLERAMPLTDGDLLRLGEVTLKFYDRHNLDAVLHDHQHRQATVDPGTGLFTRRHVMELLERELRRALRNGQPLSVVLLDLDDFKAVNDRWGHDAGDAVLRQTAAALQQRCLAGHSLGRLGGEEFVMVMPGVPLVAAVLAAERLRATLSARTLQIEQPGHATPVPHRQTASFGVAETTPSTRHARELLTAADAALYAAKRNGRNRVHSAA
jgi:diguanylate cyclase (GGDEF)-like protein